MVDAMDTPNDRIDGAPASLDGSTRHPEGAFGTPGQESGQGEPRTPSFLTRDVAWWEVSEPQNLNTPAFRRGIVRTIRGSKKRFLSIAVIVMLGTTMLIGGLISSGVSTFVGMIFDATGACMAGFLGVAALLVVCVICGFLVRKPKIKAES